MDRLPTCEWCGARFVPPHQHPPIPKYCRPSHRQRAHEWRHKKRWTRSGHPLERTPDG